MTPSQNRPGTSAPVPANGPIAAVQAHAVGTRVAIPTGMRVVRASQQREVTLTGGEVPLIHPKDPDAKQIQQVLVPRVRVFDLSKPGDVAAAEQVWQAIAMRAAFHSEDRTAFDEKRGTFVQYIRWSEVVHALPGQVAAAVAAARAAQAPAPVEST